MHMGNICMHTKDIKKIQKHALLGLSGLET